MSVLLRPRNFFTQNPCMDVPPSYSSVPSQMAAGKKGVAGVVDSVSKLAFGDVETVKGGSNGCCGSNGTNGVNGTNGADGTNGTH